MIATATTIASASRNVVSRPSQVVRALEDLRAEATGEVATLFQGVSGKRIDGASVPGFGRQGISRALNGCVSNPVFRLAAWFHLARRLGIPKSRLQRIIDWLQEQLDRAYDDVPAAPLKDVLEREEELDGRDAGGVQMRAYAGCRDAARELLEIKQAEAALLPEVIRTLRAHAG